MKVKQVDLKDYILEQQENKYDYITGRVHEKEEGEMTIEQVFKVFENQGYQVIIVCRELGDRNKRWHYHFVLGGTPELLQEQKVRELIKKEFKVSGNREYYLDKRIYNLENCKTYMFKDGCYLTKGLSEARIKELSTKSYKKATQVDIGNMIANIRDKYVLKQIGKKEAIRQYVTVHIQYNKPINKSLLCQRVELWELQRKPENVERYVDMIYDMSRPSYNIVVTQEEA